MVWCLVWCDSLSIMHILRESYEIFVYQHNSGRDSSFTATGDYIYIFNSCGTCGWVSELCITMYINVHTELCWNMPRLTIQICLKKMIFPINISEWNFITNKTTKLKALFFLLPRSVPTSNVLSRNLYSLNLEWYPLKTGEKSTNRKWNLFPRNEPRKPPSASIFTFREKGK